MATKKKAAAAPEPAPEGTVEEVVGGPVEEPPQESEPTTEPAQASIHVTVLHYGSDHEEVQVLQDALNRHGLGARLPLSHAYDARTDAAVRECQRQHGFPVDTAYHSAVSEKQARHLGLTLA